MLVVVIKLVERDAEDNEKYDYIVDLKAKSATLTQKGIEKAERGYRTDQLIYIENIKGNGVILKSEKYEVIVNEKLLKNFDKNCTFYLSGDLAAVYIYEGCVLTGVVLPIARKRGTNDGK